MENILNSLNNEQKEAVLYNNGPLLILAGAGTGKTRVLTSKIAYLLQANLVYPNEILAVTFTRKAANEMKNRVATLLQVDNIDSMWIGTFHSMANRILKQHCNCVNLEQTFRIIDQDEQEKIIKQIMVEFNINTKDFSNKSYTFKINELKNKNITHNDTTLNYIDEEAYPNLAEIYTTYQQRCSTLNVCDYGDLLLYNMQIFKNFPSILEGYINKFKYILVDEYQDTNLIQNLWLKTISGTNIKKNVFISCVGDDDQSIYGWRGAEIKNILNFEHNFKNTKIVRLERNYRSTLNILNVASSIISYNKNRHKKKLWTDSNNLGDKVSLNVYNTDKEEVYQIANRIHNLNKTINYNNMTILVRAGYQTRIFEEIFMAEQIPYRVVGSFKFYNRAEIKDCIAFLTFIQNKNDYLAFGRIIGTLKIGVGEVTLNKILEAAKINGIDMLQACEDLCLNKFIKGKTAENILSFVNCFKNLQENTIEDNSEILNNILITTGYIEQLKKKNTQEEIKNTMDNIEEFMKTLSEFKNIPDFLEHISLMNNKEEDSDFNNESVNIMTIHAAKGLEFDVVFLPSWEEEIFPSPKSLDVPNGIEEERRLAYVAITRARYQLFISYAKTRYERGENRITSPSRFIKELPEENISKQISHIEYSHDNNNDYNTNIDVEGIRIRHKIFGTGTIIEKNGNKLQILFDKTNSTKWLLEDYIDYIE